MNLKKVLLLMCISAFTSNVCADVIVDDIVNNGKENSGRPRTGIPSVHASAMGDELTIDINRYLGNAQVTVVAEDGSSTTCNTYYINGHTSFAMDFTGYNEGHYSITITLQGGQIYSGSFRME